MHFKKLLMLSSSVALTISKCDTTRPTGMAPTFNVSKWSSIDDGMPSEQHGDGLGL